MITYVKRGLVSLLIVIIYFTAWKELRAYVTSVTIVPQIEYAIEKCDDAIAFDYASKSTSLYIYFLDRQQNEYVTFGYVTPAGFYLLFGLVFIVLAGGGALYYYILAGFHGIFWLLSSILILPGLCLHPLLLHLAVVGIKYFSPFITFLILILLISPDMRKKLNLKQN